MLTSLIKNCQGQSTAPQSHHHSDIFALTSDFYDNEVECVYQELHYKYTILA